MSIEMYLCLCSFSLFLSMVFALIYSQWRWIKEQKQFLIDAYVAIEKLQDRLMAKNFNEFKSWQPPFEPLTPSEPFDDFDDSVAGTISGEEKPTDA